MKKDKKSMTTTSISRSDLNKLRELAKFEKRTNPAQLSIIIENAHIKCFFNKNTN